jgi:hypothetical protein
MKTCEKDGKKFEASEKQDEKNKYRWADGKMKRRGWVTIWEF